MTHPAFNASVEHMRVAADAYFHHARNHTIAAPSSDCLYCEDWLSPDGRYEDGVLYLNQGDEQ
jgi:hypothetical protein